MKKQKLLYSGVFFLLLGILVLWEPLQLVKYGIWKHTIYNWWGLIAGIGSCGHGVEKVNQYWD